MNELSWWVAGLAVVVVGCGSTIDTVTSGSGGSGGATSGTGATGTGGDVSSPCPVTEPSGGSCDAPEEFRCTYGDSVRPDCRHDWLCLGGQWVTTKSICIPAIPEACDFPQPPANQDCQVEGTVCTFGDTLCVCSSCISGPCSEPPAKWHCAPPPATAGCPSAVPNDGTPCGKAGLSCSYGFVCSASGALVECKDGLWWWNQGIACAN